MAGADGAGAGGTAVQAVRRATARMSGRFRLGAGIRYSHDL